MKIRKSTLISNFKSEYINIKPYVSQLSYKPLKQKRNATANRAVKARLRYKDPRIFATVVLAYSQFFRQHGLQSSIPRRKHVKTTTTAIPKQCDCMAHQFFDRSLASHDGHLRMGTNFEKRRPCISRSDKYCSCGGNVADFKRGCNFSFGSTHQFDSRDSGLGSCLFQ